MDYHLRVLQPLARDPAYYASIITERERHTGERRAGDSRRDQAVRLSDLAAHRARHRPAALGRAGRGSDGEAADHSTAAATRRGATSRRRTRGTCGSAACAHSRSRARRCGHSSTRRDERIAHLRARSRVGACRDRRVREVAAAEAPKKTGPSGIGKEHYTWYLRNVLLVPLSWEEEVTILRRELARAHASLRLEENRNRHLPPLAGGEHARGVRRAAGAGDPTLSEMGGRQPHPDDGAVDGARAARADGAVRAGSVAQLLHAGDAARSDSAVDPPVSLVGQHAHPRGAARQPDPSRRAALQRLDEPLRRAWRRRWKSG